MIDFLKGDWKRSRNKVAKLLLTFVQMMVELQLQLGIDEVRPSDGRSAMYSRIINLSGIASNEFCTAKYVHSLRRQIVLLHPRKMKGGVNLTLTVYIFSYV